MSAEHELLTAGEVAQQLRLRRSVIYQAARDGRLRPVVLWTGKRRRLLRFKAADIEALIAGSAPPSGQSRLRKGSGRVGGKR